MMNEIDWSKAPEGATHFCKENQLFYMEKLGQFHYWNDIKWMPAAGHRASYEGLIDLPAPAWSGEGLPPVGAVCEVLYDTHQRIYVPIVVLAHDEAGAVYRFTGGDRKGEYQSEQQDQICGLPNFRPIRTSEQIASEERDKAVAEMIKAINGDERHIPICTDLYCAGYRKTGEGK